MSDPLFFFRSQFFFYSYLFIINQTPMLTCSYCQFTCTSCQVTKIINLPLHYEAGCWTVRCPECGTQNLLDTITVNGVAVPRLSLHSTVREV